MKMRGAVLLASALATLAIASAVAPPVQKHAVSPFNPAHFAPTSLMFCSSRVLPLRANHRSSRCPVLTTRASLDPPGFFKKFLVGFERLLVTITQGSDMARATAVLEENRLHLYDSLKKNVKKITDTLSREKTDETTDEKTDTLTSEKHETASLADTYTVPLTPTPEKAAWREKANTPLFARNVPRPPNMNLASMGDCYGDSFTSDTFSSELSYELSGGFNEGAGDDLDMSPGFQKWSAKPLRSKYSERELREKFGKGLHDE